MQIDVEQVAKQAVLAVEDKKARDVLMLDIRGLSTIADFFVLCSGGSTTQVQAIVEAVEERLEQQGLRARGVEGLDEARWVLLDYGDVVIHVFRDEEREFYNIERLWGDAPQVKLG